MRAVSRELGLPNWSHAASPCLRSRLAFGVQATPDRLMVVEQVRVFELIKKKSSTQERAVNMPEVGVGVTAELQRI